MLTKEKTAEMFGVAVGNVDGFNVRTEGGRELAGWICKSHGFAMGSLIIETVDEKETHQFIQSMPKIRYIEDGTIFNSPPQILDKADGTNVTVAPIIIDGETVEVFAKSRAMPLLAEDFLNLVKQIPNYESAYKAAGAERISFSFELFGSKNPHGIDYANFKLPPINLHLICTLRQGKCLPYWQTQVLADKYNLPLIMRHGDMGNTVFLFSKEFNEFYGGIPYQVADKIEFTELRELYDKLEQYYEEINVRKYPDGKILIEGAVWHWGAEENYMLKCKALSVKERHIQIACGLPPLIIIKAIEGAYENLSQQDFNNEATALKTIKEGLLEEYPAEEIESSRNANKIVSLYGKFLRNRAQLKELRAIGAQVEENVGKDASPVDKMREFAFKYPERKKLATAMYRIFTGQL